MGEQEETTKEAEQRAVRKFRFLELFAGHGGFTGAVRLRCGDSVETMQEQDCWSTEWDILNDEHFEAAKEWAENADHTHFAPPCKSMTRARRGDKHGKVQVIRSDKQPEGWGHPKAIEGNRIAERLTILMDCALKNGGTFSVENPWDSYLWLLPVMERFTKKYPKIYLDQCFYGSEYKKPTAILTAADWMKQVCGTCQEAGERQHPPGGLSGKTLISSTTHLWRFGERHWPRNTQPTCVGRGQEHSRSMLRHQRSRRTFGSGL